MCYYSLCYFWPFLFLSVILCNAILDEYSHTLFKQLLKDETHKFNFILSVPHKHSTWVAALRAIRGDTEDVIPPCTYMSYNDSSEEDEIIEGWINSEI